MFLQLYPRKHSINTDALIISGFEMSVVKILKKIGTLELGDFAKEDYI